MRVRIVKRNALDVALSMGLMEIDTYEVAKIFTLNPELWFYWNSKNMVSTKTMLGFRVKTNKFYGWVVITKDTNEFYCITLITTHGRIKASYEQIKLQDIPRFIDKQISKNIYDENNKNRLSGY